MKIHRVILFTLVTLCAVITVTTAQNPVDEADENEQEDAARPIRAAPRKRIRGRNRNGERQSVQKRTNRLPVGFRPTRAPLFEASPPDPYLDSISNEQYGHSHSPPTRDPYYSPSKFERAKKRRNKQTSLAPVLRNSFDVPNTGSSVEYQSTNNDYKTPGKNYAFAYAVGDDSEDFSHKEARDGQLTIGEYRITLPDGRTQVVRYTAGGKNGYKADVTYEKQEVTENLQPAVGPTVAYQKPPRHPAPFNTAIHQQYHQSIKPTFAATPAPTFNSNSNRVYKSRPLKSTLFGDDDSGLGFGPEDSEVDYQQNLPTPRIKSKGGNVPRVQTSPTPRYLYNGIGSTTPTPRPNSIYDKISPYRGGGKYHTDVLAYAHENSPRAGPIRAKTSNAPVPALPPPPKPRTTAASYFGTNSRSPYKSTVLPTKRYKDPGQYYSGGQPQANHLNEYVRPKQHVQYLQETPVRAHTPSTTLIAKPIKESNSHLVPLDSYKSGGPLRLFNFNSIKPSKKPKKKHGIHQPLGQYLLQTAVTGQAPITYQHQHQHQPTAPAIENNVLPKQPFHYYNSFHEPHHHGFGQIAASPTPTLATQPISNNHYSNPYSVTSYPGSSTRPYLNEQVDTPQQPRMRLPNPPSTSGHVYLETPASGARPNRLGIKEALSRLPNIPEAKTTVHPYTVGSADYGKSVAYGNTEHDKAEILSTLGPGQQFQFETDNGHLDHTTSLFGASPQGEQYYPDQLNQLNFLDGFNQFDIEQANVREIRQNRQRRRRQRRPDKRRGAPASTSTPEETPDSRQVSESEGQQPTPKEPQPTARGRVKRRRMRTQQPDPMMHAVESRRPRNRNQKAIES